MRDIHWGGCPVCGTHDGHCHATWCNRHPEHPQYDNRFQFYPGGVKP